MARIRQEDRKVERGDLVREETRKEMRRVREPDFQAWYAKHAKARGLHPNPDDPEQRYDYRAAYEAGDEPDESGHWPSQSKTEGHPNMVVGGFHVKTGAREPGTTQATEAELRKLGWDADFARKNGRRP